MTEPNSLQCAELQSLHVIELPGEEGREAGISLLGLNRAPCQAKSLHKQRGSYVITREEEITDFLFRLSDL